MPQTPDPTAGPLQPGTELLADVLRRIHLASAVFLRGEFSEPWGFVSADAGTLCQLLQPQADRLVLFHAVVQGSFTITLATGESATAHAGDAVVLPYCDLHTMGSPADTPTVPIATLVPAPPWTEMPVVSIEGGGARTRILCGYLHCTDLLFNPLLRTLPRLILVRPGTEQAGQWREATLRYAVDQGSGTVGGLSPLLARLPEMVLVDCLRQYALDLPPERTGWLAALRDPVLARALMLLHARPADPWTVDSLAQKAAASRSVLADRFAQTLEVSPMRYLTQWRMQLAADLLRTEPRLGMAEIADRVGYESEAAFSRAFKRCIGEAPAGWARRGEAQTT